jgi:hypothetical protein
MYEWPEPRKHELVLAISNIQFERVSKQHGHADGVVSLNGRFCSDGRDPRPFGHD